MHRTQSIPAGFFLLFSVLFSPLALAIDPGWYGNIGLGISNYSEDELQDVCDAASVNCGIDNDQTGYRFGFGHKFNPYLSLEGGYMALGDVTYSVAGIDILTLEATGPYVALLAEVPLGQGGFSLLGTVGGAYLDGKLSLSLPLVGTVATESEKGALPFYGLGAAFNEKSGKFTVRLMWERITSNEEYSINGNTLDAPDVDMVSLAAIFRFGR